MVITYHGENYFKIVSGSQTILIDPTNQRAMKGADVVLFTENRNDADAEKFETFVVRYEGEYEVRGIRVRGWSTSSSSTLYYVLVDDIAIVIFGYIEKDASSDIEAYTRGADIIITPVGNGVPSAVIAKLVRHIEPSLIIPSSYRTPQELKTFLKEFNQKECLSESKLTLKKKDLKPGALDIKCLSVS